jgi:predicted DNA-binding protein with PD1-like motif
MLRFSMALMLMSAVSALPEITRREVVKATTPEQDAKGLSPDVPDSTAIPTQFERVVILRLRHQADILAEIEKQVKEQKIGNAVFLNGIGSAISTHHHVVSNRSFPSKNVFIRNPEASADIVNVSGFVLNGRIHAHITFADADRAYGGHLEPGTRVFTFAIITVGVLPGGLDLSRLDDKTLR